MSRTVYYLSYLDCIGSLSSRNRFLSAISIFIAAGLLLLLLLEQNNGQDMHLLDWCLLVVDNR